MYHRMSFQEVSAKDRISNSRKHDLDVFILCVCVCVVFIVLSFRCCHDVIQRKRGKLCINGDIV